MATVPQMFPEMLPYSLYVDFQIHTPCQSPSTFSPFQDMMSDYRTPNSMLLLGDCSSPSSSKQTLTILHEPATPASPSVCPSPCLSFPMEDILTDLRQTIASDYQQMKYSSSLLSFCNNQQDVTSRELDILTRLKRVGQTDQVKNLSSVFRHHSANIEMERVQMLSMDNTAHYREWLTLHFDQQRHQIMDRVEKSLQLVEKRIKSEKVERDLSTGVRRRSPLSRRAIQLMEAWYSSHQEHPYPSATVVQALSTSGNVSMEQVRKWFANKRIRACNTRSLTEIAKKKHQAKFSRRTVHVALEQNLL